MEKVKILVVDKQRHYIETLKKAFDELDQEVEIRSLYTDMLGPETTDGQITEFIESVYAEEGKYDIVFMDYKLNRRATGTELMKMLKKLPMFKDALFIAFSHEESENILLREAGARLYYFKKPMFMDAEDVRRLYYRPALDEISAGKSVALAA